MAQPSLLDQWIKGRKELGLTQPLLQVSPEANVLVGWPAISKYLGIRSWATFYQWVEVYGFPAIKRPDGMWMTTMTAIDQWIFLAAEADNDVRPHSRGAGKRVDVALRRLTERAAERRANIEAGREPDLPDGPRASWTAGSAGSQPTSQSGSESTLSGSRSGE